MSTPNTGVAKILCLGAGVGGGGGAIVHTFEAVAASWGSVSVLAVGRVMGGDPERNKNSKKYR